METATARTFWSVVESRRTVRFYTEEAVADETLDRLLRAAVMAPSAHNAQPSRFVVVQDRATRERLVAAMARRWADEMRRRGLDEKVIAAELRFSMERFTGAPALVLACLTMEAMDRYPEPHQRRAEHVMGIQSAAAAIQNLLLAAEAEGLGACWTCAPLFCQGLVRRVLRLPRAWEPQALITIGRPRAQPPAPPRRPMAEVVRRA